MNILRLMRHLATTRWSTRRSFPQTVRDAIEKAIGECESRHGGEIRFVVETAFDVPELWRNLAPRTRALQLFGQFGVWNTEHNNGVLIYLLLADRKVEIVADRGIDASVGSAGWEKICRDMEAEFAAGRFEQGALAGIAAVSRELARHFPHDGTTRNELPDAPVVL